MPSGPEVSLVSQRWLDAGCALDEPSRRAIVSAVLHEIERTGEPTTTWIDQLYAFDPTLAPTPEDVHHLRVVLRELLPSRGGPEEAARLQHRTGVVVDDLLEAMTKRRLDALEQTARVDALTGLGNRRAGEEALQRAFAHARRRERPLAVAMLDLDGLKQINDTEGHLAGDDVLRRLGTALAEGMRTEDAAYRFGGDEFVVVAPETSAAELRVVLERIRRSSPSFSIGVAELTSVVADSAALLALADADLYRGRRGEAAAAAATPRRAATLFDPVIPLVAVVVGVTAALAADGVRRIAGIEISEQRWLWLTALAATPVVLVAAALRSSGARSVQLGRVLRGGGLAVLTLVAALTPLVSGTIERRTAPRTGAGGPDSDRIASPPTTQPVEEAEPDEDLEPTPRPVAPPAAADGGGDIAAPAAPSRTSVNGAAVVAQRPLVPGVPASVGVHPSIPPTVPVTVPGVLLPVWPERPIEPDLGEPDLGAADRDDDDDDDDDRPARGPRPTPPATIPPATTIPPGRPANEPAPTVDRTSRVLGPPRSARADEHGRGAGPDRARRGEVKDDPPGKVAKADRPRGRAPERD